MPSEPADPPLDTVLAGMNEPFLTALTAAYTTSEHLGAGGKLYPVDAMTRTKAEQGRYIYELCLKAKAKRTLEIGLAYGFSTCFFLAALKANEGEQHIACDPFQFTQFNGIGFQRAPQLGMEKSFRLIEEFSSVAISKVKMEGLKFGVIYIDGSHFFDDTLVDFTLASLVCEENGYIVLDDMWMPALQKVVSFIDSNRKDYVKEPTPISNITVYRKISSDVRLGNWQHYVDF